MNPSPARHSRITGTGSHLPPQRVDNAELAERLAADGIETSDAWIVERTGIRARHFVAPGVQTSDIAVQAARHALEAAGRRPEEIDLVVLATSTPDMVFPSTACIVQRKLGIHGGAAFDVQAVCTGFVYALALADSMIRTGLASRALVIGAEVFSRILDFKDRTTCVLFGDGAGAMVLEAAEGQGTSADRGILATDLNSDGQYRDLLYVDGGVASTGTAGHLRMQGNLVFRHAVEKLADTAHRALDRASLTPEQVDWLVPHQANLRIIEATAKRMHLPMEKVVLTVADHGNTSAASIPLALSVANAEGRFKPGDVLVAEAIGGGLAWGSVVLRW